MEAFIYGCHRMFVYLTILFNLYVKCGYVPSDFCKAVIIPLGAIQQLRHAIFQQN